MDEAGPRRKAVLVDDHELLSLGLQARLATRGVDAQIAELGPLDELISWVQVVQPDVVVLDLGLPYERGGLALLGPLAEAGLNVLNLTGETDAELWAECFELGALGVLDKAQPLDDIMDAITVAAGGQPVDSHQRMRVMDRARHLRSVREASLEPFGALSTRETHVLAGLMEGHSPQALATRDFVSIETVRSQIKSVLRKLGARSQLEAVAMAHQVGWRVKD